MTIKYYFKLMIHQVKEHLALLNMSSHFYQVLPCRQILNNLGAVDLKLELVKMDLYSILVITITFH